MKLYKIPFIILICLSLSSLNETKFFKHIKNNTFSIIGTILLENESPHLKESFDMLEYLKRFY